MYTGRMDLPASNIVSPSVFTRIKSFRHFAPRAMAQTSISVANFVQIQVAARVLETHEFGLLSLILAVNAGMFLALYAPVCEGINRFLHDARRNSQMRDFHHSVAIVLAAAIAITVLAGGTMIVADWVGALRISALPSLLIVSGTGYIVAYGIAGVAAGYYSVQRRYYFWLAFGFAIPALTAVITGISSIVTRPGPLLFIACQCAITTMLIVAASVPHRKSLAQICSSLVHRHKLPVTATALLGFIWVFPFLTLGRFIFTFADRFAVANFFTLAEVGTYGYMYILTTTVVGAVSTIYYAATYLRAVEQHAHAASANEAHAIVLRFTRISLLFPLCFVPLLALYFLWDQRIATIVLGAHAVIPPHCLPLLLAASGLYFGSEQLSLTGYLLHRVRAFLIIRWIFAAMLIAGLLFFHSSLYQVSLVMILANIAHFVAALTAALVLSAKGPALQHFEPFKA